jgi:transketolase
MRTTRGDTPVIYGQDEEDHWPEGGLADAVRAAFSGYPDPPVITSLAVEHMPTFAIPDQQLRHAGIDRSGIAAAVRAMDSR